MAAVTTPEVDSPSFRPRVKRSRLPPDPSSTLLQGVYLKVPSRGGTPKLLPGGTHNPLFGPLGISHDVSFRLDSVPNSRSGLADNRPATVSCCHYLCICHASPQSQGLNLTALQKHKRCRHALT